MEWIEEAEEMQAVLDHREQALAEHEVETYEVLWGEVMRHVAAARAKFPGLQTGGTPYERTIALKGDNKGDHRFFAA
jgi:hypothetical protein